MANERAGDTEVNEIDIKDEEDQQGCGAVGTQTPDQV